MTDNQRDAATTNSTPGLRAHNLKKTNRTRLKYGITSVVLSVVILAGLFAAQKIRESNELQIDRAKYQAVYLTNGQMYFGQLQNTGGDYLYLKMPYTPESTTGTAQEMVNASNVLVRVKDKLWGPEDSLAIRADQVAFWQNLRSDSKVSTAIDAKTK